MAQLNDDQTREINRDKKVIAYLTIPSNKTIADTYEPFKDEIQLLKDNVAEVLELAPEKEQTGTGITLTKEQYKRQFADLVGEIFSVTRAYCTKVSNADLAAQVKASTEEIYKFKDATILPFANNLHDNIYTSTLLTDTIFLKYKITQAMVDNAVSLATEVNKRIGEAKSVEASSDSANAEINTYITLIRKNIAMLISLLPHFKNSQPKFVDGFNLVVKKDDIGVRHTGGEFTIKADGIPSEGLGSVTIGKKTVVPDLVGVTKPVYCRPGNRKVTAKYPGKPDKEFIHYFISREIDKITIEF